MIYIFCYLIFIYFVFIFFKNIGMPFFNNNSNPFLLTIAIKFFVTILPASFLLYDKNIDTILSSVNYGVSIESIYAVSISLAIAFISFLIVAMIFRVVNGDLLLNYNISDENYKCNNLKKFVKYSILFQLCWFLIMIVSGDAKPLIYLMTGNFEMANMAKASLLRGEFGSKLPIISYIPKYYFVFVPLLAYEYFLLRKNKRYFILSLFVSCLFFVIEGHKAPLFMFAIYFFVFRNNFIKIKFINRMVYITLAIISLVYFYFISFGFDIESVNYGLSRLLYRAFIGQAQGLFYIFEYIKEPDISYASSWLPFSSLLLDNPMRVDAQIVRMAFPDASDSYVNMNTFFTGEAFAIFSWAGIVFCCFYVWSFCFYISYLFKKWSMRHPVFFIPLAYAFFINIPISQGLGFFIFPKELLIISIFFTIYYSFYIKGFNKKVCFE